MQITRRQLQQIIREEILREGRSRPIPPELRHYVSDLGAHVVRNAWQESGGDLDAARAELDEYMDDQGSGRGGRLPPELEPYIKALGRDRVQMSWVGNEGDLDSTIYDLAAALHRRDIDKMASDLGVDLPTRDLD